MSWWWWCPKTTRRLEDKSTETATFSGNDEIEIFVSRISKDYKEVISQLEDGFTNEDLKNATNNHIDSIKQELLDMQTEGNTWIDESTTVLDDLKAHVNTFTLSEDQFGDQIQELANIWKQKASESINAESSSKLLALASSVEGYKIALAKKISTENNLREPMNNFLKNLNEKIIAYAGYLEEEDNQLNLNQNTQNAIQALADDSKGYSIPAGGSVYLYNQLKEKSNKTFYQSLNADNLRYILDGIVKSGIEDLESLKNPEKESNFVYEKEELKPFIEKLANMVNEMNDNQEKLAVVVHTKPIENFISAANDELEKVPGPGEELDLKPVRQKLNDELRAANKAIDDGELKAEFGSLISDYINHEKIQETFEVKESIQSSKLYEFLTTNIMNVPVDEPTRILHTLNKSELSNIRKLTKSDRMTLTFIRTLISEWKHAKNDREATKIMDRALSVMNGTSGENMKLRSHKFDISSFVSKFKELYNQFKTTVGSVGGTATKMNHKIKSGRGAFTGITDKLNLSTTGAGLMDKIKGWFTFGKKEGIRRLIGIDTLTKLKEMSDNLEKAENISGEISEVTQKIEEPLKKFEDALTFLNR